MEQAEGKNERIEYAASLSEFNEECNWYDKRASAFKQRAQRIDLCIILAGALVAALPIFKPGGDPHWSEILVSLLGAVVVIGQGAQRIFRYGETWPEFRLASESM